MVLCHGHNVQKLLLQPPCAETVIAESLSFKWALQVAKNFGSEELKLFHLKCVDALMHKTVDMN